MKSVGGMRGLKLRMRKAKIQSPAVRGRSSGVPLEGCVCVLRRACHQRTLEINQSSEIPRKKKMHAVKLTAVGYDLGNTVRPWVSF